ncbi:endolytic transglycosylase MltG [Ferrimonas sediminicola]|uniref:Endolytic murein transglycosylase n=1 Tax=Ferrimonas sediminicola TaxID=2569538 RepID=A0A4U1BGF2_9GAMM|nr:endolytic transglycosylase MltG [Ferrimonas sediminicola]TKB50402.1 endolytic transglycosylase MltG [Ferrimonas sediminicola]
MNRWMTRLLLSLMSLALALVVAAAYMVHRLESQMTAPLAMDQPTEWTLPEGATTVRVANLWSQAGWVPTSFWIKVAVRLEPGLAQIKAGTYELTPQMSVRDALQLLVEGRQKAFRLTLVEGETLRQALARIAAHPKLVQPEQGGAALKAAIGFQGDNPEGMLFPDTYQFHAGDSAVALVKRSSARMQREIQLAWSQCQEGLPLKNDYQMVILASIIEKETALAEERPLIGSVFINRLNRGMRLQTDPTVIYGMGERFNGNITKADLLERTPYNTYRIRGLPPTPIALVGREALQAACQPAQSKYYYFVSRGDGSHHFSRTLREHNQAVNKYIRKRS